MPRYIDADRLIKVIRQDVCSTCAVDDECVCAYADCITYIEDCPTADVKEVKHGRWEKTCVFGIRGEFYRCSACELKEEVPTNEGEPLYYYCPWCGAKMDLEVKDNV